MAVNSRLTSEEMTELQLDVAAGRRSRLKSDDAKKFRAEHERFVREVTRRGGQVEIPFEHSALDDDEFGGAKSDGDISAEDQQAKVQNAVTKRHR